MQVTYRGKWHGKEFYFGLHYDLHANANDTDLGERCDPDELAASLKLMKPDYVQTDCKGHPGMTSWFSEVPTATVSPGVKKDALKCWREATRKLGLPLHCHYSGIWDIAASERFPDWRVVPNPKDPGAKPSQKMCPRGPYLEHLLIPHLVELVDRYGVDGFWIDGDLWAVEPCYCERCRAAFREKTGLAEPPTETSDPDWVKWINFHRESFEEYVTRYCDAVHGHRPGVLVCSNWLQTFSHPDEPKVPTDWISGDTSPAFGMDVARREARFISTRGKPWDLMLWGFYRSKNEPASPYVAKPVQMLLGEAAVILAFGGNLQLYEHPPGLRDGRLAAWRMKRLGEVGRFARARKALCWGTETIPQVGVLHSEHHHYSQPAKNLHWGYDTSDVQGAVYALLEDSLGVDIMDEWALLPGLDGFPLVVAPEQDRMSDEAVEALKGYVAKGGRLLVTGARAFERFGAEFLGAKSIEVKENATYHVPAGDGSFPLFSREWRLLEPTSARPLGSLGKTALTDDELLPHPAATVNRIGKGAVAYVPCELFRCFCQNRYPMARALVGELVKALKPGLDIRVKAPVCVDVILRRKGGKRIVHLINRASGIPNQPHNSAVDEIPRVGPVEVEVRAGSRPKKVRLAFEKGGLRWRYASGKVTATVASVQVHAAVVIE